MQDRFQAIIKRRLQIESEQHPPLFPWESELQDYPDWDASEVAAFLPWLDQLRQLKVPAKLPDEVLVTLLERCQELVQMPIRSGIQLVKAVEGLFPDQPQTLERLAGLVLTPTYRSGQIAALPELNYEQANPQQQIALTMMAAQDILTSLKLDLTTDQPRAERHWQTAHGILALEAVYHPGEPAQLEIHSRLPGGGYVRLVSHEAGLETDLKTEREMAGDLYLALPHPQAGIPYTLMLGLNDSDSPLLFSLSITTP